MGTALIFILLAVAVSFFVALPMMQARGTRAGLTRATGNHRAADLEERKQTIYAAIKELEFDYQMGKLSEEDFKELRQQYKDEAIALLKKLDQAQMKAGRAQRPAKGKAQAKAGKAAKFCWICGTPRAAGDKFCPNCGTNLQQT